MKENSIKNERSSIEEDIKILKSIIKINNDYLKGVENQTINQKEIKALEHVLSDYKRVLKENEELKKIHIQDNKHLDFIMEHSISIQKIKDKIEGLSKIKGDFATSIAVSERIKVLIELLESEEK